MTVTMSWLLFSVVAFTFAALGSVGRYYVGVRRAISTIPVPLSSDRLPPSELPESQKMVNVCVGILKDYGCILSKDQYILDFGCGSGRHTYEFRDQGFSAIGFDLHNNVRLREESDIRFFIFPDENVDHRIPQPDNTFDFVFSTSVLEHVTDYNSALREIHRVLKPGGVSLHEFPSRWRPIEPHIYVPFGGRFRSYSYFLFWAAMGIRNEFQVGKKWREVAQLNWVYSRTGLGYLTKREILFYANLHFKRVTFMEANLIRHTRHASRVARLVYPITRAFPFLIRLYAGFHTRVLVLEKTI
jgi:SAM-dependent methyltransferase